MGAIFEVFIDCYNTVSVLISWLQSMWDLSCPIGYQISTPCIGRPSLNHWTAREVPHK